MPGNAMAFPYEKSQLGADIVIFHIVIVMLVYTEKKKKKILT